MAFNEQNDVKTSHCLSLYVFLPCHVCYLHFSRKYCHKINPSENVAFQEICQLGEHAKTAAPLRIPTIMQVFGGNLQAF